MTHNKNFHVFAFLKIIKDKFYGSKMGASPHSINSL
jgi:hypothetical protein